jgi:tetratricopeptide (TPR) repeat protein
MPEFEGKDTQCLSGYNADWGSNKNRAMNNISARSTVTLLAVTALAFSPSVWAHDAEVHESDAPPLILGVLDFPNSGTAEAQDAFSRGVKFLHSFEFEDARTAFVEAQEIDPEFVMAIWGEAMTRNYPIWARQERDEGLEALTKLKPISERNATAREERYLDAVFILYGDGDKPTRDIAYMNAMQTMYEDYPEDLEAAAFYSLSILGSVYERDFRTYMKAASIAEEVFAKQPQHPGAAHYMIHSYDDQIHAPLGLRAARAYTKIAPNASHAQHMVSHIYTSLGMWDEVIEANRTSVRVSEDSMKRAGREQALRSKHALHWLEYGLLQQGHFDEAVDTLQMMKEDALALPNGYNLRHAGYMRASYLVEAPQAARILPPTDTTELGLYDVALECFSTAFEAIVNSDLETARSELALLDEQIDAAVVMTVEEGLHEIDTAESEEDYLLATVVARQIDALLKFHRGETDAALVLMMSAAEAENSQPMYYGPPHVPKPSNELTGEMLLTLGRAEEAANYFSVSLQRSTGRSQSLLGLARAQEANDDARAAETWQTLENNWRGKISDIRDLEYTWLGGT